MSPSFFTDTNPQAVRYYGNCDPEIGFPVTMPSVFQKCSSYNSSATFQSLRFR